MKRFLCGVEGVRETGNDVLDELLGGVCDLVGSLIVVEWEEGSRLGSGERLGGVGWGIVVSKISDRSNVENVRFASSAERMSVKCHLSPIQLGTHSFENEARHEEFASSVLMASQGNLRHEVD